MSSALSPIVYISGYSPELLSPLVESGRTPEPFEMANPFGQFFRVTKGEAFWQHYLIRHGHVFIL